MEQLLNEGKYLESSFNRPGSLVKLIHASLVARKGIERIYRTAEVQLSPFTSVCESGKMQNTVFNSVQVA